MIKIHEKSLMFMRKVHVMAINVHEKSSCNTDIYSLKKFMFSSYLFMFSKLWVVSAGSAAKLAETDIHGSVFSRWY